MGPLGLRYADEDGFWEVCVYPTPVELVLPYPVVIATNFIMSSAISSFRREPTEMPGTASMETSENTGRTHRCGNLRLPCRMSQEEKRLSEELCAQPYT
jgi:hypothetical protein